MVKLIYIDLSKLKCPDMKNFQGCLRIQIDLKRPVNVLVDSPSLTLKGALSQTELLAENNNFLNILSLNNDIQNGDRHLRF